MISAKHCITGTIEGNGIDIIYIGELEIHTVLMYHCATYSVSSGSLLIVLYLALTAKSLDTPVLCYKYQWQYSRTYYHRQKKHVQVFN